MMSCRFHADSCVMNQRTEIATNRTPTALDVDAEEDPGVTSTAQKPTTLNLERGEMPIPVDLPPSSPLSMDV
jgi:hypothetical protein